MKIFPIRIKSGIYILLLCIIAACSVCCAEQDYYVEGNAEQLDINILEKKEKPQEKTEPQQEPYVFWVSNLEDLRMDGVSAEDFYQPAAEGQQVSYYTDPEGQLYGYDREADGEPYLIARDVVHVDTCRVIACCVFLTREGELYGLGSGEGGVLLSEDKKEVTEPKLLMEDVRYVVCGDGDIVVLKKDNSVWTWGAVCLIISEYSEHREIPVPVMLLENAVMVTGKKESHAALLADGTVWTWGVNFYSECGVPGEGYIEKPVCVARDAAAVWTGEARLTYYGYDLGYCDNTFIRKTDGSLWGCGKWIAGQKLPERKKQPYTHEFMPCEIRQEPEVNYHGGATFYPVLKEYEMAWRDPAYRESEEWWKCVDPMLSIYSHREGYTLCYSLKDLTGDGTKELIIGLMHEGEYSARVIYAYCEGEIFQAYGMMERPLNLYRGGIIEEVWGASYFDYLTWEQMEAYTGRVTFLDRVALMWVPVEGKQEEEIRYCRHIDNIGTLDYVIELTQQEYTRTVDYYRSELEELEWKPVEGFWKPQDIRVGSVGYIRNI